MATRENIVQQLKHVIDYRRYPNQPATQPLVVAVAKVNASDERTIAQHFNVISLSHVSRAEWIEALKYAERRLEGSEAGLPLLYERLKDVANYLKGRLASADKDPEAVMTAQDCVKTDPIDHQLLEPTPAPAPSAATLTPKASIWKRMGLKKKQKEREEEQEGPGEDEERPPSLVLDEQVKKYVISATVKLAEKEALRATGEATLHAWLHEAAHHTVFV